MSWIWKERHTVPIRDGSEVSFEPLSQATLDESIALAESIFSHVRGLSRPAYAFRASLAPSSLLEVPRDPSGSLCRLLARGLGVADMRYRIMRRNGRVVGFNGTYVNLRDPFVKRYPGSCKWGGWSGVVPELRGCGAGLAVFWDLVATLRAQGIRYLRIFGTTHSEETKANGMYDRWRAEKIETEARRRSAKDGGSYQKIYWQRDLTKTMYWDVTNVYDFIRLTDEQLERSAAELRSELNPPL